MPKDKTLKTKVAMKALKGGKMTLYQFKSWAHDKFGEKLGEKVYQNAVRLKKGIKKPILSKGRPVPGTPGTALYESKKLRERKKKPTLQEIIDYHKKKKRRNNEKK